MSDSEMAEHIAKVRQEVSQWPEWKKNLLADSVNPYWREEKAMSDSDKMRAEFEKWVSDNWRKLEAAFAFWDNEFCYAKDYEAAFLIYAAGRKAEQETIRKLISPEVVAPLIKLSEVVDEALKRSKSEIEQ